MSHTIVTDILFGDGGKGITVDRSVRSMGAETVIRYNGACQAAHNVATTDGRQHIFSQFGAGTFAGAATLLAPTMLVEPIAALNEAAVLAGKGVRHPLSLLTVHEDCPVITPMHKLLNRIRETARGNARHGSCGRGVGEAVLDATTLGAEMLRAGDLRHLATAASKLSLLWERACRTAQPLLVSDDAVLHALADTLKHINLYEVLEHYAHFTAAVRISGDAAIADSLVEGPVVFEGAQGVLLDPIYGFVPHVTKTRTTSLYADRLLQRFAPDAPVTRLGVLRAYATRHGAGPFVTEDAALTAALPDAHNGTDPWQGSFRSGWLDLVALRYALAVNPVDALAITCLDRLSGLGAIQACTMYAYDGESSDELDRVCSWTDDEELGLVITAIRPRVEPLPEDQERLTAILRRCRPLYEMHPGWSQDISDVRRITGLPDAARALLTFISDELGTPIASISVGPGSSKVFTPGASV